VLFDLSRELDPRWHHHRYAREPLEASHEGLAK
jgi:hypothetical protein